MRVGAVPQQQALSVHACHAELALAPPTAITAENNLAQLQHAHRLAGCMQTYQVLQPFNLPVQHLAALHFKRVTEAWGLQYAARPDSSLQQQRCSCQQDG
jgi:hypothetical protein